MAVNELERDFLMLHHCDMIEMLLQKKWSSTDAEKKQVGNIIMNLN